MIDRIAAVVNEDIITLTDIDKSIQFYPVFRKKNQSEQEFYLSVLQDLINYRTVYLEFKEEFPLQEEDYLDVQTSIIKKVGSYNELMRQLQRFDMKWQDFKDFIKEKVVYEKVLTNKLQVKITVNFNEIRTFYNEQYLPLQQSLELTPKSLIEMAPSIETQLRKERTEETLAGWLTDITAAYKIENKLLSEK